MINLSLGITGLCTAVSVVATTFAVVTGHENYPKMIILTAILVLMTVMLAKVIESTK